MWRFPNYTRWIPSLRRARRELFDQAPLGARLAEIRCPTLVLVGSGDTGLPRGGHELVRDIPGTARVESAGRPPAASSKTGRMAGRSGRITWPVVRDPSRLRAPPTREPVTSIERFSTDAMMQSVFPDPLRARREKLESLYSKSKRHQWNAELDVDVGRLRRPLRRARPLARFPVAPRLRAGVARNLAVALFREAATFTLSQVLHGEQAALMVCGQLVNVVPDLDGKFAAAVQVMTRRASVEVFARYLEKVGRRYPIDPDLKAIVERILAESDWEATVRRHAGILESVSARLLPFGVEMARSGAGFVHRNVHERTKRATSRMACSRSKARIPICPTTALRRLETLAYSACCRIAGRGGKPSFTTQWRRCRQRASTPATFIPKLLTK